MLDPPTQGSKLNLDDLLAPLATQSSALQSLKKSTKALAPSSSKAKTLSAPLPQRAQERLDREAAYEQTKGEVDKWSGTMKRIREVRYRPLLTLLHLLIFFCLHLG
jgi:U3 small nucleolar RNA-associated protein 14